MTRHKYIGWLGFAVLLVLHLDFWRSDEIELYFGWLPRELGYRLLWMALGWAYLIYFCRYLWTAPADDQPGDRPGGGEEST